MKRPFSNCASVATLLVICVLAAGNAFPWNNGPSGKANTNAPGECTDPPYSTHDWIAEHGLMLLPQNEREWLMPHKALYLLGTEAPDNDNIPTECGGPNN